MWLTYIITVQHDKYECKGSVCEGSFAFLYKGKSRMNAGGKHRGVCLLHVRENVLGRILIEKVEQMTCEQHFSEMQVDL